MMMQFDIYRWSPNFLSTLPYHLQLKDVISKAIEEGRFPCDTSLAKLRRLGIGSLFQKEYVKKAYELLVTEGKLTYISGRGYCIVNRTDEIKKSN